MSGCVGIGHDSVAVIYRGLKSTTPTGRPTRTPNGVALSTHARIRCDIDHYAHRVAPGHRVVGRSSMPKSKAIDPYALVYDRRRTEQNFSSFRITHIYKRASCMSRAIDTTQTDILRLPLMRLTGERSN